MDFFLDVLAEIDVISTMVILNERKSTGDIKGIRERQNYAEVLGGENENGSIASERSTNLFMDNIKNEDGNTKDRTPAKL